MDLLGYPYDKEKIARIAARIEVSKLLAYHADLGRRSGGIANTSAPNTCGSGTRARASEDQGFHEV